MLEYMPKYLPARHIPVHMLRHVLEHVPHNRLLEPPSQMCSLSHMFAKVGPHQKWSDVWVSGNCVLLLPLHCRVHHPGDDQLHPPAGEGAQGAFHGASQGWSCFFHSTCSLGGPLLDVQSQDSSLPLQPQALPVRRQICGKMSMDFLNCFDLPDCTCQQAVGIGWRGTGGRSSTTGSRFLLDFWSLCHLLLLGPEAKIT